MKKIRLKAINLPEGFGSNWVEYEFEELAEEPEGMVSKEAVLKVFDEQTEQNAAILPIHIGVLRKALSEM